MFMFQDATKLQRAELQHHNTESTDKQLNGPNNDGVIQFPTVRFLCLRLRVFQRCLSLSHESEMSRKQGPPTHLQARTNRNDFSAGEHPLQLSSPRQCLREKAWETLFLNMPRKVTNSPRDLSGDREQVYVTHCENWDIFVFRRDLAVHVGTGCPGRIVSLSTSGPPAVRWPWVCALHICVCVLQYD